MTEQAVSLPVSETVQDEPPPLLARLELFNKLLLGLVVLTLIGGVASLWGYLNAQDDIRAKMERLQSNSPVTLFTIQEISDTETRVFGDSTTTCNHLRALKGWYDSLTSAQREAIPASAGVADLVHNGCVSDTSDYGALNQFLKYFVPAVGDRQLGSYDSSASTYTEALRVANIEPSWQAQAYEGLAYADLKLSRFDDAERAIESALAFKVDNVFVSLTQLKLACARRDDPAKVRALYSAALAERGRWLDRYKKTAPQNVRYAEQDIVTFRADPEAPRQCGYAHVKPVP